MRLQELQIGSRPLNCLTFDSAACSSRSRSATRSCNLSMRKPTRTRARSSSGLNGFTR
jgi:hypothetical protein